MRGKGPFGVTLPRRCRIIPAHAGKSLGVLALPQQLQDHPRSCGEKFKNFNKKIGKEGSSPLMRGKGRHAV